MAAEAQVSRTILLPVKQDERRDADGNLTAAAVPELWGHRVEVRRVRINYHDVGKFLVRGDQKVVEALAEQSKAHFREIWKPREPADDDDE